MVLMVPFSTMRGLFPPLICVLLAGLSMGQATRPADPAESAQAAGGQAMVYRQAALDAVAWIRAAGLRMEQGTAWPADPGDPETVNTSLYNGAAGVVVILLEAHRFTGDAACLADARNGADYLLGALDDEKGCGLYVGLAGMGFALQETFKVTGAAKYRDGARRCVELINERARQAGAGVEWSDVTDIISGSAGIGLFLLYAARELNDDSARALAAAAGRRLVELARPGANGLQWAMDPEFPRLMPNFSHGTAGVAYFLTCLYAETGDEAFLEAARAGHRVQPDLLIAQTGFMQGAAGIAAALLHAADPGQERIRLPDDPF